MYKQEVEHKLLFEIKNYLPVFKIGIKFRDLFSEDTYMIVSDGLPKNIKNIPFCIYKNNELLKECTMINNNINQLLEDTFSNLHDYDLKQLFYKEHKDKIIKEVSKFIEYYDEQIIMNEIGIEGELRRMKQVAGINNKLL